MITSLTDDVCFQSRCSRLFLLVYLIHSAVKFSSSCVKRPHIRSCCVPCVMQLVCVCRLQCVVVAPVGRVGAAGRIPGLVERLWRMTAARLAAESRWTNGVSCPNGGRMAHGKVTITVDEYSSNPTQAFTHYNINQSRFQPPHVHMWVHTHTHTCFIYMPK